MTDSLKTVFLSSFIGIEKTDEITQSCWFVPDRLFSNVEIRNSNGASANSFSNAFVEYNIAASNSIPLSWFWCDAIEKTLLNCLNGEYRLDSLTCTLRRFLKDIDNVSHLKKLNDASSEAEIQAIVAHHLFSRLSPSGEYVIDRNHLPKGFNNCPACNGDLFTGDTSIGNFHVWYGHTDIMIDKAVVKVKYEDDNSDDENGKESFDENDYNGGPPTNKKRKFDSSVEASDEDSCINTTCKEIKKDVLAHAFAETIVNAFYQACVNPNIEDLFIPSFIISNKTVKILMYNCKKDRLYVSEDMYLFRPDCGYTLNIGTIISIWLALNFESFQNKVEEKEFIDIEHDKTSFQSRLSNESLSIYKKCLQKPLREKRRPKALPLRTTLGRKVGSSSYTIKVNDRLDSLAKHFKESAK